MVQFSFVDKLRCSFKDCDEILEPNMLVLATDPPTLMKASKLVGQFVRFYCEPHMTFIKKRHKAVQTDKLKRILENPDDSGFMRRYGDIN